MCGAIIHLESPKSPKSPELREQKAIKDVKYKVVYNKEGSAQLITDKVRNEANTFSGR